ncbi:lipoyl synthase, organellar chromatophore [Candidatus Methanoplasma termitum]|uniref:LIAS protein n=1 Tax=Candidatus Methanoplasma termitum TaxID=1577791 RepID=A0A0A7LBM1_9ARCH|nr:radical SAM protein [Candidatus Methanoplasma termitum]AIZ56545.1 lipoyl synthase, organellar chromatophore [Candidatus Methanoplasma termitum]
MEEDVNVRKKAELILGGGVRLPEGFVFPFRVSRSTAGPGAGSSSAVFSFYGHRVKKSISYDSGEFVLIENDGILSMTRGGEPFLDEVRIEPVVYHSPEQAFFNIDQRCMYHCAFCVSPLLGKELNKRLTDNDIVRMTKEAIGKQKVVSVSLTSGVADSVDKTVDRFVSCVSKLRKEFPELPIGVEPYVSKKEHVRALKEAGATEIKLNIQSPNRKIFEKACPDLDYDRIIELLLYSVNVFGPGMVTSNMIFGMGETDEEIEDMFEFFCSRGIIPTVRSIHINSTNSSALRSTIGEQPAVDAERIMRLARMQKRKLAEYGLDTRNCHTMCIECGCCDIVPFRDI